MVRGSLLVLSTCDQALSSSQYQETLAKDSFKRGLKDKIHNDVTSEDLNSEFNLRPFLSKYGKIVKSLSIRERKKIQVSLKKNLFFFLSVWKKNE
jgi:hypothetical protein